jgi:hypothetical protein
VPTHGNHWEAICGLEHYAREIVGRDFEESELIGSADCVDVVNDTERAEEVACLRHGSPRISNDLLMVTDSRKDEWLLFTAYPVLHDGIVHPVTIKNVRPWQHGIEAWIDGCISLEQRPITWFDTHYWRDWTVLSPGVTVDVSLAALAYELRPLDRRLSRGCHLRNAQSERRLGNGGAGETGLPTKFWPGRNAPFLPCGDSDTPDEWQFRGVIKALDVVDHDGQDIYRLEMDFQHPGNETIALPVFVSEHTLDGYVPRLGANVEGILWLQGQLANPERTGHSTKGHTST